MWFRTVLLACFLYQCAAYSCECGIFVRTMFPGLSMIDPLNYLPGGTVEECSLMECREYCASVAPDYDYSLDLDQGGQPRGAAYCQQIDELYGGGTNIQVPNEQQAVRVRLPDCDFFVWDTSVVYSTDPTLCCSGATWC